MKLWNDLHIRLQAELRWLDEYMSLSDPLNITLGLLREEIYMWCRELYYWGQQNEGIDGDRDWNYP
jgi:hypothetical protein